MFCDRLMYLCTSILCCHVMQEWILPYFNYYSSLPHPFSVPIIPVT